LLAGRFCESVRNSFGEMDFRFWRDVENSEVDFLIQNSVARSGWPFSSGGKTSVLLLLSVYFIWLLVFIRYSPDAR
jgi:hypothetical protein